MISTKRRSVAAVLLMIASLFLGACETTQEPVREVVTQVVEKEVTRVVEGTPIVETVVETKVVEKIVTATPEPEAAAGGIKRGGILKWARQALPMTLDPVWTDSNFDIWLFQNIYEPLVRMDPETEEVKPALAESWDVSEDGLTYTFHLQPDAKFHDGNSVTAADVVWSLDRARDPDAGIWSWTLENIESLEGIDDATVEVKLTEPAASFLGLLSMFNASILPGALVEEAGPEEFFKLPLGTGPFQVTEYVVGDHIVFEKNPYYWDLGADGEPLPYLDGVRVVQVPESSTRVLQVQAGEMDGTDDIPLSMASDLETDPAVSMEFFPSTHSEFGWLNHRKPPLDDVNVRLAMNYAINRQALIDTVLFGRGEQATSFRAVGSPCWNPDLEGFPFDLEKAKQLMAESNYPDGYEGLLITTASGNPLTRDVATVLKEMWAEIGITVETQALETGLWYDEYDEEEFVVKIGGWTDDVMDALQQTEYMAVDPAGRTGWSNEQVIELANAAAVELDSEKRCELYYEIQKIFNEDAVEILLFSTPYTILLGRDVQGFNQTPLGWLVWRETWLDR